VWRWLTTDLPRRLRFFFRERYWWIVLFFGVVLLLIGAFISSDHMRLGPALVGIGTSMLATMLVSFSGPDGDETYRDFLQLGVREFYANRNKVPNDSWVDWLESAQRSCLLLGIAHGNWTDDDRFEAALMSRLVAGIKIEILFLDPATEAADTREKEDHQKKTTKDRIRDSIRKLWEIRNRLPKDAQARLSIYTYTATPSLGVTWIDDWMLVTHYLAGFNNLTSPALKVESSPNPLSPYAVYAKNVERIRDMHSEKVSEENIEKFTNVRP
jgi:hypothetical protein